MDKISTGKRGLVLLTKDSKSFVREVTETLEKWNRDACLYSDHLYNSAGSSVVLCLFSECLKEKGKEKELCFVFNTHFFFVHLNHLDLLFVN